MSKNVQKVINFYLDYDEDRRMERNPLEFIRCKEIISRYLVRDNLSILDIGGATGVFSFWLAEQGHDVSLIDFVPKHIDIAKKREKEKGIKLSSLSVGDARDLIYQSNSFDIVLLMGPLYHLQAKTDRIKSLKEAYRVLKPNGIIISEVISRFASMVDGFLYGLVNDPEFIPIMHRDILTGIHNDTSKSKKYFTDGYFHQAEEVTCELEQSGFVFKDLIAVTSFGSTIPSIDEKIKDEDYKKNLLDTIRLVEKEKTLLGISSHCVGIGEKKQHNKVFEGEPSVAHS
jgi:ubiquinone/menaquinone biosynthesis C-methylase UbiE